VADFESLVEGFKDAVEVSVGLSLLGVPVDGVGVGVGGAPRVIDGRSSISKSPMPTPARSAAPRADALPEAGVRGTPPAEARMPRVVGLWRQHRPHGCDRLAYLLP
jgi:hypothetical protein